MSFTPLPPMGSPQSSSGNSSSASLPTVRDAISELLPGQRTVTLSGPAMPQLLGQPAFSFVRLKGQENLNSLFEYEIELKTRDMPFSNSGPDSNFDLRQMNGRELQVAVQLDGMGLGIAGGIGAGTREINGLVNEARYLRAEGRHFVYGVTLRPWLWLATLNKNSRIFEDKTDIEIIESVLSAYSFPVEWRLDIAKYPKRIYRTQCDESDYHFVVRLMEHWGIAFFFEHSQGAHRLVIADQPGAYRRFNSAAYHTLKMYPPGVKVDEEHLTAFSVVDAVVAGKYSTSAYSFAQPRADFSVSRSDPRDTGFNTGDTHQEVYDYPSEHTQPTTGNDPWNEGDLIARIRMQAIRSRGLRSYGQGNLRAVVPGCTFTLARHPQAAANREYLILGTELELEDTATESGQPQQWRCTVRFEAHPTSEIFRPARVVPWPVVVGPQSATVTGPANVVAWPDEYGRVRVTFPWDRFGGTSCWMRVATTWAGSHYGQVSVPRIGTEVLVSFMDGGDPDKPIITSAVPNQLNMPPWQQPGQHALAGIRSQEHEGNSSNHLLFDDTKGKIQAQLASDYLSSRLSLGHITRVDSHRGRQDHRGDGAELATDGQLALRGGDGLLITTEARPAGKGHHKDMSETVARLDQAQHSHHTTGQLAQHHNAQDSEQQDTAAALKTQNDEIRGTGEINGELTAPHLVIASQAGLATTVAQSTHLHSGEHFAVTTGQHASITSNGGFFASAMRRIVLFARSLGIRIIAATDHITLEAQDGDILGTAKRNIHLRALGDMVFEADQGILFKVGGTYLRITPQQIIDGMSGARLIHASGLTVDSPDTLSPSTVKLPDSDFDQKVYLHLADGTPASNRKYRISGQDGKVVEGVTGADGLATLQQSLLPENFTVHILDL